MIKTAGMDSVILFDSINALDSGFSLYVAQYTHNCTTFRACIKAKNRKDVISQIRAYYQLSDNNDTLDLISIDLQGDMFVFQRIAQVV